MIRSYVRGIFAQQGQAIWSPVLELSFVNQFDSRDVSDGVIASWPSRGTFQQVLTASGDAQPTKTGGFVVFNGTTNKMVSLPTPVIYVSETPVPDAQGSSPGHGFSNNGSSPGPGGQFWLTNGGLATEISTPSLRRQSLCLMSADFLTINHQVDFYTLIGGDWASGAPASAAYRPVDDTLYTCNGGVIRKVGDLSGSGSLLTPISYAADSVAYSVDEDSIYALQVTNQNNGTLKRFLCSDGSETLSFAVGVVDMDQVGYDPTGKTVVVFGGDNNGPNVRMGIFDPINTRKMTEITFPSQFMSAIEQGCFVGNRLLVNHNGYYHANSGAQPPVNEVFEFNVPPCRWAAPLVSAWAVVKIPSVGGVLDFLFGSEEALAYNGWGIFVNSVTSLGLFFHTGVNGNNTIRCGGNFTVPNLTSTRIIYAEFSMADGVTLWVDGELIGNIANTLCTGLIQSALTHVSNSHDAGQESRGNFLAFGSFNAGGEALRLKTEGYAEHQFNLDNLDPAHIYKDNPPLPDP